MGCLDKMPGYSTRLAESHEPLAKAKADVPEKRVVEVQPAEDVAAGLVEVNMVEDDGGQLVDRT